MGLHLDAPHHTTLSRRAARSNVALRSRTPSGAIHLVLDSSGLAIFGEGEWAAAKHGRKGMQGWKTLHLGVDQTGSIVAQTLTDANADDASTGIGLIKAVKPRIKNLIGDAAYDTRALYTEGLSRGARVIVYRIANQNRFDLT